MQYVSALVLVANCHRELQTDHFPWNANPTWIRDPIQSTKTTTPPWNWHSPWKWMVGRRSFPFGCTCLLKWCFCSSFQGVFFHPKLTSFSRGFHPIFQWGKSVAPWFSCVFSGGASHNSQHCYCGFSTTLVKVSTKTWRKLAKFKRNFIHPFFGMQKKDNRNIHIMFEKISGVFEVWIIFGYFGYPQTSPPK